MTHKDALVLMEAIRESKCFKYVVAEMKDIQTKVKHGMILFKNESDKLEALYRRVKEMEEREFSGEVA